MFDDLSPRLGDVLAAARELGFLGPAPFEDHVTNGRAFAAVVAERPDELCVDLGSGGGVPALVVALAVPQLRVVCVDRGVRRCAFLVEAVQELELAERVTVHEADAEVLARDPRYRGGAGWVTARSFGPPGVTAEAGVRFLRVGGELVVSEPPGTVPGERWDHEGLAELALGLSGVATGGGTALARCVRRDVPLDDRYPRRAATVRKRPLF